MPDIRRLSARGIVLMHDAQGRACIALMHRLKPVCGQPGKLLDYYVTPGGGVEDGESIPQAAEREIYEELGIHCIAGEELFRRVDAAHDEHILICSFESGEFGTGSGPEFTNPREKDGSYIPVLIPLRELSQTALVPEELKELILTRFCSEM